MADLPVRPNLLQLRHRAKDLLRSPRTGDSQAMAQIRAVSERLDLASAQLTVAREYGFPSWPRLKNEVDRRLVLNRRDVPKLRDMIGEDPSLATRAMEHWCDHKGISPLSYMAMLRFDSARLGLPRRLPGTGAIARVLLESGAPVDGAPGDRETPVITAASYGDAEVARVLIEFGANLEATAAPDAGGVPGGTALPHAAVFGMTEMVDVLAAAGARVRSIEEAAAVGDISGWLRPNTTLQARMRALVMAADHQRLNVIDELVAVGTPVDAVDAEWGRQALCVAVQHGRPKSARHLLALGADVKARDGKGRTPLDYSERAKTGISTARHTTGWKRSCDQRSVDRRTGGHGEP